MLLIRNKQRKKEILLKEWNCVVSIFLTSFNVDFMFGYACFMCICLKTATWLFWGQSMRVTPR